MPFGKGKLELLGFAMVKEIEDMFIRFDTIHEQTDRHTQTPHDGIGRAYA